MPDQRVTPLQLLSSTSQTAPPTLKHAKRSKSRFTQQSWPFVDEMKDCVRQARQVNGSPKSRRHYFIGSSVSQALHDPRSLAASSPQRTPKPLLPQRSSTHSSESRPRIDEPQSKVDPESGRPYRTSGISGCVGQSGETGNTASLASCPLNGMNTC